LRKNFYIPSIINVTVDIVTALHENSVFDKPSVYFTKCKSNTDITLELLTVQYVIRITMFQFHR